jgi:hypothetical protein
MRKLSSLTVTYSDRLKRGEMTVEPCERFEVKDFIEANHYSKSINGVMASFTFRLMSNKEMVGAMLYGNLGMANAWKKYADSPEKVIELRRLCLIDDTPKNSESYFIAKTISWLKQNTEIETIVSYADPNYGHQGTIYKATNFEHVGMTAKGKVIWHEGRKYHDKAIRTKYNGKLKPFAERLKQALDDGTAYYDTQEPKHIYVYKIKKGK